MAIAAAMVLLCGGVGCSGSGSSTGSTPAAATGASSGPPPDTTPAAGSQGELDAYLARVIVPRRHGNRKIYALNRLLNKLGSTADSSWDRAALRCRHVSQVMISTADRLGAIVPPLGLAPAHLAYAESWRADGLILSDLATMLKRHEFIDWNSYNAQIGVTAKPVTRYRIALIAYAAKHRLHLPKWVKTIGG